MVGLQLHHAYAAELACHPAGLDACLQLTSGFNSPGGLLTNGWILQLVPALIGAFVGAPLLAREMETGSYRYAWTQGFGRWRWTLAKLAGLAGAVTAAAGAISVLFSWYYPPYFGADNKARDLSELTSLAPSLFDLRGSRVRRMDAGSLRDRRPGRRADPQGRPRDCRHPGRVRRTCHRDRRLVARALFCANRDQETERAKFLFGL